MRSELLLVPKSSYASSPNKRVRHSLLAVFACAIALLIGDARADLIAHRDKSFFVEGATIRAEFREDCSDDEANKEPIDRECPWILRIAGKATDSEIGRVQDLRLTNIWISDDERYVVGLSHVQAQDGPHIFVANTKGKILGARRVVCGYEFIPVCTASVTQRIFWYQIDTPGIQVFEGGDGVIAVGLNTLRSANFPTGSYEGTSVDEPIPDRFIVPLNCSLSDHEQRATGLSDCREYELNIPGDFDTPDYNEMSEQERFVLGQWLTKNHLDAGRHHEALQETNRCLAERPDHCGCMMKRVAILKTLDRHDEAGAQRAKTGGRCW